VTSYLFIVAFLFISLKPVKKLLSKKIWLLAFGFSMAFLIPSIIASYDSLEGGDVFEIAISLAYPVLTSVQLIPVILGISILGKNPSSFPWMLLLFAFLIYSVSDIYSLFSQLDETYYVGHPVDLMHLYSFIFLIFSIHSYLKTLPFQNVKNKFIHFSENEKFDTINRFGTPLVLVIISMIVIISTVHSIYSLSEESISAENIMIGIVSMLGVFAAIIFTINRNMKKFTQLRTKELVKQRDILEHLVEEKTNALLKAERLSAIGELSGRLAHDLRNPLSVMKMSTDLIKKNSKDSKVSDDVTQKRLDLIRKSIDRISHQVDDVLDYVRTSPLQFMECSVRETIFSLIERISIPDDVEIVIDKFDMNIVCDPEKMEAVFINILMNSIQAMPNGGTLSVKLRSIDDFILIDFIDSGTGISEESIGKIFEPLFTTKQKGTGLGLASCKNIVEQHHGTISVKNNPTTFSIKLPKTPQIFSENKDDS
jgi:signal transduction histidine kinase